jgi:hypothetical protein
MSMTIKRKAKHKFLTDRSNTEAFVVVNLSNYTNSKTDDPRAAYMNGPGLLWPTKALAQGAAQWALEKNPGKMYGVFKLACVVEQTTPPVKVTDV